MNAGRRGPILICYDGSRGADGVIEFAASTFPGAVCVVLTAWEPYGEPIAGGESELWPAGHDLPALQVAGRVAAEGCRRARCAGLDATQLVVEAPHGVTAAVLDAAEEHDAMIIAVGARGLRSRGRGPLGPVARAVADHADRPLIVVPPTPVRAAQHQVTLS